MGGLWRVMTSVGFLSLALLPLIAAVSPEAATSALDALPTGRLPVAIAQPLAVLDGKRLVAIPRASGSGAMLQESGMLVLVGSALFGLAAIVRRTTDVS